MTSDVNAQAESNKATVARILQRISQGDVDGFVEALAPTYVRHCQAMPPGQEEIRGPETMRAFLEGNKIPFPDYREDLEMLVAEGDFVAWRSVGRGTQSGPMGPFPPTGRVATFTIIGMHRFEGGRIAETWTSWDNMAIARQLGAVPGPPAAGVGGSPMVSNE